MSDPKGVCPEEVRRAEEKGFFTISLGPRILRAETAVLTLIGLLQYLWGDLKWVRPFGWVATTYGK